MSVPELNDGDVYIVTRWKGGVPQHLGDYRTFAEALACAHRAGAIGTGASLKTISGESIASLKTISGESIFIDHELMDPLDRSKS